MRSSKSRKLIATIATGAAFAGAATLFAAGSNAVAPKQATADAPPAQQARLVRTTRVDRAPDARAITLYGQTQSVRQAQLAFQEGGRIQSRVAEIGQRVNAGEVVAALDARAWTNGSATAAASVGQLEARREQVVRDLQRAETLAQTNAAPREQVEQLRAALAELDAGIDAAKAQLREARRRTGETRLAAPFAGVVTDVLAEPGELVSGGQPVVVIAADDAIEVELEVPEAFVARLSDDQPVSLDFPMAGLTDIAGTIASRSTASVRRGRLFAIRVTIASPPAELLPGMSAIATLELPEKRALAVPIEAVVDPFGNGTSVYRVQEGRAERVAVNVRALRDALAIIDDANLAEGDEIVVGGHATLVPGENVEVAR
jgi:RND family efflux transporter MFP subunit